MNLSIIGDKLQIELEWFEQLWAFYFDKIIEIPLAHIIRVTTEEPASNWAEIRAPGTFLPGVIKAGTYYTKRGKEFWYVTSDKHYLTLELDHESYRRIILTLDQNEAWLERIEQQIQS
jgi:hypothetical protein